MTGLDKIIDEIISEANANADQILSKANKEADEIRIKSETEADAAVEKIQEHTKATCKEIEKRAKSSAQLCKRQIMLSEKQQIISEINDKAYNEIINSDSKKYFDMILKMIKKYSLAADGEILFNGRDLQRLPNGFAERINNTANGRLHIGKKAASIDGGFILTYGGIEQNCSFKAIFNAQKDELQDKIHSVLFL